MRELVPLRRIDSSMESKIMKSLLYSAIFPKKMLKSGWNFSGLSKGISTRQSLEPFMLGFKSYWGISFVTCFVCLKRVTLESAKEADSLG